MPRFFVENENILSDEKIVIGGEDAKHISLSLRARVGEKMTVCDGRGMDYECEIEEITKNEVNLRVLEKNASLAEPSVKTVLYQALVKSDKFDFIVQKCTELGVSEIVPVITERCISRPDDSSLSKKIARWNKIAREAAMQSGRGRIPVVRDALNFNDALSDMKKSDCAFLCYEAEPHIPIDEIYGECGGREKIESISFFVGPEGGIAEAEAEKCSSEGIYLASLGPRILRAETAPLCVVSSLMLLSGNMA